MGPILFLIVWFKPPHSRRTEHRGHRDSIWPAVAVLSGHTGADMAYQVTTGRFVGRTQEVAWPGELLARAAGGEPLVVLLGGEAGVGKTRLADQLASMARGQGVRVLGGGCVPLGEEARRSRRSWGRCAAWPIWTPTSFRRSRARPAPS
jgi:hypothetical protein